jgi:hypothetical protein
MPSPGAALRLIGEELSRRVQAIAYDQETVTAWEEGDLVEKLRPVQRKMRTAMHDARALKYVFNCSRRLGKTFLLLVDALEIGIKETNAPLKFAAPTQKQMKKILLPIFREITMDCPQAIKPIWKAAEQMYVFPTTGSELTIAGCNNGHEENLRGTACRKAYVDEAQAFKGNLIYVVQDILMPQLLTLDGSMVIAGTPPKTPVHDFVKMMAEARAQGHYTEFDIWEAGYSEDLIERFKEEAGGEKSTTWRREYLCQVLLDDKSAIIPEWKHDYERVPPRDEYFQFWEKYIAMDIGGRRDRTVNLFAWYDFHKATLYVDAEAGLEPAEMTTRAIADGVNKKTIDTFGDLPVRLRVADNNNEILLKDLGSEFRLHYAPTNKDTLQAMVNQVRIWVAAGRVVINPACVELIGCLKYGIWNEKRDEFERFNEESEAHRLYGHFDALAALIYLVRNIDVNTNPVPYGFKLDQGKMFVPPPEKKKETEMLSKMFRPRFRR